MCEVLYQNQAHVTGYDSENGQKWSAGSKSFINNFWEEVMLMLQEFYSNSKHTMLVLKAISGHFLNYCILVCYSTSHAHTILQAWINPSLGRDQPQRSFSTCFYRLYLLSSIWEKTHSLSLKIHQEVLQKINCWRIWSINEKGRLSTIGSLWNWKSLELEVFGIGSLWNWKSLSTAFVSNFPTFLCK